MKRFSFWLMVILAVGLLASLSAVGAPTSKAVGVSMDKTPIAAPAYGPAENNIEAACTTVWLKHPSYSNKIGAGAKKCLTLTKTTWIYAYKTDGSFLDFVSPYSVTKVAPHNGDGSVTAKRIKNLAAKYNVKLQFANVDFGNRPGCNPKGFYDSVSGTYQSSSAYPGKGLVRLGTGKYKACISKFPKNNMDLAKHEISHAIMERKCDGRNVYREENTTDAYAWYYLKTNTREPGNYGFVAKDLWRAKQVHAGKC